MKKYSILILLVMCLFLEVYFEKNFPYLTIMYGLILGVLFFYTEKTRDKRKGLSVGISIFYYIVKYMMSFHLILVYLVFLNYLRVSDSVLIVYYTILLVVSLSLVGLDFFDIVKWYKNKSALKNCESHLKQY